MGRFGTVKSFVSAFCPGSNDHANPFGIVNMKGVLHGPTKLPDDIDEPACHVVI